MRQAIILARVSSDEQEAGYSLEAQLANLQTYAQRKELNVVQVFRIIESSTKGHRPEFERMIDFIGRQKQRTALIIDCVDRLQRSFTHTPVLNALMEKDLLEIHFVREGNVMDKEATSTQKLMWNFGVLMAQSYTDQLTDNVKRSIKHKIQKGEWIAKAPMGYRNQIDAQTGRGMVVVDAERALFIRRIFTEYATGTVSMAELTRKTKDWGVRTDKGHPLAIQSVFNIIDNPFYYGMMRIKGMLYPHNYPPLIDKGLFDMCQAIRGIADKPYKAVKKTKQAYILRGLITCAASGRKATCDLKKGKHIYLMTRDPADTRKKLWVKENTVMEQITKIFEGLSIPDFLADEMLYHVKQSHEAEMAFHHDRVHALQLESNSLMGKMDRLTDLLMERHIEQPVYDRKREEISHRQQEVLKLLGSSHAADNKFKLTLSMLIKLMRQSPDVLTRSKPDEKRQLIGFVFSNLKLEGATLRYTLRKPFNVLSQVPNNPEWRPLRDSNPCYYRERVMS